MRRNQFITDLGNAMGILEQATQSLGFADVEDADEMEKTLYKIIERLAVLQLHAELDFDE